MSNTITLNDLTKAWTMRSLSPLPQGLVKSSVESGSVDF